MVRLIRLCGFLLFIFIISSQNSLAVEFHVRNTMELQNALTTAQNNGQDDIIYLAAGVYSAVENGTDL